MIFHYINVLLLNLNKYTFHMSNQWY